MQIDSKTVQAKRHTLSVLIISFRAWDSLWSLKLARKWVEPSLYLNFWPIFGHPALNALEKYKWAWTVTFALNSILWSIGGRFNPHLAKKRGTETWICTAIQKMFGFEQLDFDLSKIKEKVQRKTSKLLVNHQSFCPWLQAPLWEIINLTIDIN